MDEIRNVFSKCRRERFPNADETVNILEGLEAGGADIIELGVPFTDPIADGPTIQKSSTNGMTLRGTLNMVRQARQRRVKAPIILMGYLNPILSYGEEKMVKDAKEAGANGFIVVDLPPEEAIRFRGFCRKHSLSYIPLIAPSTPDSRLKLLSSIADSFIYVVSRMGTTGAAGSMSASLPGLCNRVHKFAGQIPIAVGFGVSTREHFLSVGQLAEGVVIGSQIVTVITNSNPNGIPQAVKEYCEKITEKGQGMPATREVGVVESIDKALDDSAVTPSAVIKESSGPGLADQLESLNSTDGFADGEAADTRFGEFGGQYVPESLIDCLVELERGFNEARNDPKFWAEFRSYYPYMGRPSSLHLAERLTEHAGGANIWLKREDLNHTGSHKINNALGQILIARRLGKTEIIAETGAGQHGVATATVCAKFGMKCTVYMGAEDVRRQALNVFRMKLLGAQVIAVESGTKTLRDAVNEALRAWVVNLEKVHYIIGSAIGPHPFPVMVRTLQSVIGQETKEQFQSMKQKLPDAVVACVGGGSNSVGMFYPFSKDPSVKLLGVEAGGDGIETMRHSATLTEGKKGVLHGVRTYILQSEDGQVQDTHSVSAGLDYPGVGPELSMWKDSDRAQFIAATDAQAFHGFRMLTQLEGIIPALESAHAVHGAIELAKTMPKDSDIVICLSGRGDKDVSSVAEELPRLGPMIGWDLRF